MIADPRSIVAVLRRLFPGSAVQALWDGEVHAWTFEVGHGDGTKTVWVPSEILEQNTAETLDLLEPSLGTILQQPGARRARLSDRHGNVVVVDEMT